MTAQDMALFLAERANQRVTEARMTGVDRANGAIERVSSILRHERQRFVARKTKLHPLVTLPLAVIRRLMEHSDLLTRVALSHTCSNVFQAAIATPHLWTEFTFSFPVLSRVSHLLQKSAPLPVHISLSIRLDATTLAGLEVFAESIFPRLEYFDITFIVGNKRSLDPSVDVSELAMLWHRINAMLSAPAPLLHSLFVELHTSVEGSYYLDHGILNGAPNNLRTCSLHGVMMSFTDPCAAFSLLETFNWVSRKAPITLSDVCSLVKHASRLHTIGIKSLVTSQSESVELACSRQGVGLKRFCAFVQEPVDETGRHVKSVFINLDKLVINQSQPRDANSVLKAVSVLAIERLNARQQVKNACNPLINLPKNVLARLLVHCDLGERITLSETSSALRCATRALPHIWREAHLRAQMIPMAMCLLSRSFPLLARVTLTVTARDNIDKIDVFTDFVFPRLEYFDLSVQAISGRFQFGVLDQSEDSMLARTMWHRICRAIALPAQNLRNLYLAMRAPSGPVPFLLDPDLLGGVPGSLESCTLSGIRARDFTLCTALSTITRFEYVSYGDDFCISDIRSLYSAAPLLETFGVTGLSLYDPSAERIRLFHPSIERISLSLARHSPSSLQNIVSSFAGARRLVVAIDGTPEGILLEHPECQGDIHVVAPLYGPSTVSAHGVVDLSVRSYIYSCDEWTSILASDRLVSLTVHELELSRLGVLPDAPNLQHMFILLASCCDYRATEEVGIFTECGPLGHFPSLRTLHLSHVKARYKCISLFDTHLPDCGGSERIGLTLLDVVDLIVQRLQLPPNRRLDRLTLSGIRNVVDVDLHRALEQLRDVVFELEFAVSLPHDILQDVLPRTGVRKFDPCNVFDDVMPDATDEDNSWALLMSRHRRLILS
ncbi:hypothetical protein EXIGLDRAFT_835048 [Exidia glandulosa HHB12029]|uniref:F-box domain-containing protein n=1 Tax=Exidia glandulosa HHB12029 TaxID=1314781 RepID=A0A165J592_EXIGL|nr:hypothetical protein EXIGLDRAFT_835048 [Exidia glandulosa HHB12029]